jgi:Ran-binding protein 3
MSDHAVHPRLASSASLNTTSATNSDNEGGEKPVREKLKQTTIAGLPQDVPSPEVDMEDVADEVPAGKKTPQGEKDAQSGSESDRGRVGRKRSFDDIDDLKTPEKPEPERHTRKRSRDIKAGDLEQYRKSSGESSVSRIDEHDGGDPMTSTESRPTTPSDSATKAESMGSPKSKRVREEEERLPSNIDQAGVSKDDAVEERQPKRHRDSNSPKSSTEEDKPMRVKVLTANLMGMLLLNQTQISPGSGFANVSAASPFASLGSKQSGFGSFGSKKDDETAKSGDAKSQTSTSAFQKSGLGSFASASSPFASLNSTGSASPFSAAASTGSASPFGAAATTAKPSLAFGGATKSPTSSENGFAALGSSGKSTFGNASGFGGGFGAGSAFGGGFGGLSKPAGSGFAAPGTSGITGLSDKPAKPFGAQEDDDEDSGSDDGDDHDDEDAKPHHVEEGGRDRRFYAQEGKLCITPRYITSTNPVYSLYR